MDGPFENFSALGQACAALVCHLLARKLTSRNTQVNGVGKNEKQR